LSEINDDKTFDSRSTTTTKAAAGSSNNSNDKPKQASLSTAMTRRPMLHREISKEDFDLETTMMQKDLDNLKEMLSGQITFDTNILSNLFRCRLHESLIDRKSFWSFFYPLFIGYHPKTNTK
jgi:hypothetical protein